MANVLLVVLVANVVGVIVLVLGRWRRLRRAHLVPSPEAPLLATMATLIDVAPGILIRQFPRMAVPPKAVLIAKARAVAA